MKKKKIALLLAGVLVLSTFLTACGDKETTNNESSSTQTESNESTEDNSNESSEENESSESNNEEINETDNTDTDLEELITDEELSMEDLISSVVLCDYSNVEVNAERIVIDEASVQNEMKEYLSFFDVYEHIEEGTVEDGSTANVTFVGKMDGEEFDGGSGTFDLEIGSGSFIDGFEDGLIGKNVGDEVTLELKFPDDYYVEEYQGKDVTFDVTINYLNGAKIESELTDEFLSAYTDYETVEALYDAAKNYLEEVATNTYTVARENGTLDYIINNSTLPKIPRSYIDDYVNNMVSYYQMMADMYSIELADLLSSYTGMNEDEFMLEAKKSAVNYMQSAIILGKIAQEENLEVSEDEVDAYIKAFAESNAVRRARPSR